MKEIIIETLLDSLKLLPFLFIAFFIMEYLEHKVSVTSRKTIKKAGYLGPLFGGVLGAFPQCGFSVAATNFYATRIISLGTLIAIYLSTSDEMLPILISEKADFPLIVKLLGIKVIVGILVGFIIDFILRGKSEEIRIDHFCHEEHCDCSHGIFKSAIKHTLNIMIFILLVTFVLNLGFGYLGKDLISKIFMRDSIFGPFLASFIGLIPNCGASVILTELYLNDTISFASVLSGLLTSSGVALLILFKVNKDLKENIKILTMLYSIGVFVGIIFSVVRLFL